MRGGRGRPRGEKRRVRSHRVLKSFLEIFKAWERMYRRGQLPGQKARVAPCRNFGCLYTRTAESEFCSEECERNHLANLPE